MKNIFEETIERVALGAKFSVDFEKRSLKVNNNFIILDNEFKGELGVEPQSLEEVLSTIDEYYAMYKHSVPSERSETKRKNYFYALPEHELDDDDMLYGQRREVCQVRLELYILACILNGSLVWNENTMGKWFYQSKSDSDLVILKNWIA